MCDGIPSRPAGARLSRSQGPRRTSRLFETIWAVVLFAASASVLTQENLLGLGEEENLAERAKCQSCLCDASVVMDLRSIVLQPGSTLNP